MSDEPKESNLVEMYVRQLMGGDKPYEAHKKAEKTTKEYWAEQLPKDDDDNEDSNI